MIAIAAVSLDNIIGINNELPWQGQYKADLARFKKLTMGNMVIMGRRTYESIGKPLPNRKNVVISHLLVEHEGGPTIVRSMAEVFEQTNNFPGKKFVIGGETTYKIFLPFVQEIDLTIIPEFVEGKAKSGDTIRYFPYISPGEFEEVSREEKDGLIFVKYQAI